MISEFPLFLYTTLAGIVAGAYVVNAFSPLAADRKRPWLFSLICLAMLAIGGVGLFFHLGHPERILNAFRNPGAGITQEGFTTILFGICVFADFVLALAKRPVPRWFQVLAAVLGVAMTVTMGLAYYAFIGTPAWNGPATVPFFIVGDLAMGAGFFLLFKSEAVGERGFLAYDVAVEALTAVVLVAVAAQFAGAGYSPVPFVVALVVAPVLVIAVNALARKGAAAGKAPGYAALVCVLAVAGIVIARYAFYMGCLI